MSADPAIVVTGTASDSIGVKFVGEIARCCPGLTIITVDVTQATELSELPNVYQVRFDLNPYASGVDLEHFARQCGVELQNAVAKAEVTAVDAVVLCAGVYESGLLADMSVAQRQRVLGVNVCGKIETLHAAMSINTSLGISNAERLTVVDVGSLHGLRASPLRSLYAASKSFGLDVCLSLSHGKEVKRAVHVAFGPVDTHMLHRNHWVDKEGGAAEFVKLVRKRRRELYAPIFIACSESDCREAAEELCVSHVDAIQTLRRYHARREAVRAGDEGMLSADDAARALWRIVYEHADDDGVYLVTGPNGHVKIESVGVDAMVRGDSLTIKEK